MVSSFSIGFAAAAATERDRPAHAAVARVQRLDNLSSDADWGAAAAQEVVVPGTGQASVSVTPGLYAVQVILPTGRILQEHCEVGEDEVRPLIFEDDRSEDRFSLQGFGGSELPGDVLEQLVGARRPGADVPAAPAARPLAKRKSFAAKKTKSPAARKAAIYPRGGVGIRGASASAGAASAARGGLARSRPRQEATAREAYAPRAAPPERKPTLAIGTSELLGPETTNPLQIWSLLAEAQPPFPGQGTWMDAPPAASQSGAALWHLPGGIVPMNSRRWAIVESTTCREIFSLPLPWRAVMTNQPATLEVAVDAGARGRAMTSLAMRDPLLEGLLAYFDRGQLASARPIVEALDANGTITQLIMQKNRNPLAACAAAYVGLAIFDPGEQERWDSWLPNLMNWFPRLPDGGIVHARRIVLRPSHPEENQEALAALKRAFRAGIPYYSVGVQLMREMLSLFLHDAEAAEMYEKVRGVASRVDLGQMFTVLRYPKAVA